MLWVLCYISEAKFLCFVNLNKNINYNQYITSMMIVSIFHFIELTVISFIALIL